ncbi:hypothetical protein KUD97_09430 [Desulfovibrio desulfuricans]|uniref:hypothetical protein n=1 Tax=Desulfovibrio desulfuricans TaxID=876 RepID=UPI001F3694D3|nr:hypothetical protein [Desulfovibrio desulfuricans]UIA99192.1 hypothetical protein KUD97_09430 [Desulfovibrio desulfuricans]
MSLDILCTGTMTLYYRSIWPVAKRLIQDGHKIYMVKRGCFSESYIRDNPKAVTPLDDAALRFICDLIGMDYSGIDKVRWIEENAPVIPAQKGFHHVGNIFRKLGWKNFGSFDVVLSVNKCFSELSSFSNGKTVLVALPYQNIPDIFISKDFSLAPQLSAEADSLFTLRKSALARTWFRSGLPFSDSLVHKKEHKNLHSGLRQRVLLLHPGGRRGVVSQDGDTYETCLANQRALYEQALALLPSGWTLGLKIHPLAAAWHDVATNQPICDALGITLHPGDWPGKYIFAYDAIISLGSSLIFENIGSGVPCFIASFLGGAREGYYSSLSEFYLESADELRRALGNVHTYAIKERQNKVLCEFRCDGLVTEDIVQKIYNFCEHKYTNEMHSIKNVF